MHRYDYMMAVDVSHIVDELVKKRVSSIIAAMLEYIKDIDGPLARPCEESLVKRYGPPGLTGAG